MKILIVAEKNKAAERISFVLFGKDAKSFKSGDTKIFEANFGKKIYRVMGLKGHIYSTEFARSIHRKGWLNVDPKFLLTKAPLSKVVRDGSKKVLPVLKKEIRNADVVIVATDYDREGENIGMQIVDMVARKIKPRIVAKRARFSSFSRRELEKSFREENLRELNYNLAYASEVRQEVDLRMGIAFTRLATISIQQELGRIDFPMISIGPCQTPTLGLVVERYIKHLKSAEEAEKNKKFVVKTTVFFNDQKIEFQFERNFENKKEAKRFAREISKKDIKIIDVKKHLTSVKRPLPLNTVKLASIVTRVLKIPSKETLRVAEKLYLEGYITYPRTETDKYSKYEIENLENIFNALKKNGLIPKDVQYNKPLNGRKSDGAHPPIRPERVVPLKKIRKTLKFDRDLATKIYDLIVKHFAANLMEDATVEEITLIGEIDGKKAVSKMKRVVKPGFLRIYKLDEDLPLEQNEMPLPQIGNTLKIEETDVVEKLPPVTQPISESELVRLMDKLGIGTDATFAEHINKILKRKYVERRGGRLVPTPLGLALYEALRNSAPDIIDPKIRAEMEKWFTLVEKGEMDPKETVKMAIEKFETMYDKFYGKIPEFTKTITKAIRRMGLEKFIKRDKTSKKAHRKKKGKTLRKRKERKKKRR
ncbi:MAG: DNA topoisomerase [Candidatus Njordarchaeia archaeon]